MKEQKSAVFFAFISGLAWSFTGLFSRLVSWNPFTLVGLRAPIALLIIGLGRGSFRIRPNKGLWVSAAGITLTSLMFMAANRLTTAANAIVLQYTASIFVMLYSFLIKKQKPLKSEVIAEIADLEYHVLVLMADMGITLDDVEKELRSRR